MKQVFLTAFFLGLLTGMLNAQHVSSIDSLVIIPSNPTVNDTVMVKVKALFYTYPCSSDSATVATSGLETKITAYFQSGIGATSSYCKDTIRLGTLSPGINTLVFRLYNTTYKEEDIDTIMFFVSPASNISLLEQNNRVGLYPNPAQQQLFFYNHESISGNYELKLYSAIGQLVCTKEIVDHNAILDVASLPKGIYTAVFKHQDTGNVIIQKVILIN